MKTYTRWSGLLAIAFVLAGAECRKPLAQTYRTAPVHVAGELMSAQRLMHVGPRDPEQAKHERVTGAVVMHAIIREDGIIELLEVVSGPEMLRAAAANAVRQWTCRPIVLDGRAVPVEVLIIVDQTDGEPK